MVRSKFGVEVWVRGRFEEQLGVWRHVGDRAVPISIRITSGIDYVGDLLTSVKS